MTYVLDDQALFNAALTKLQAPLPSTNDVLEQPLAQQPEYYWGPGFRDFDHPCGLYMPGKPQGDCESDGHYLCTECMHLKPEKLIQPDYMSAADCKTLLYNFGVVAATDDLNKLRELVWSVIEGVSP